jgi:small subunit ribosomal protein S21
VVHVAVESSRNYAISTRLGLDRETEIAVTCVITAYFLVSTAFFPVNILFTGNHWARIRNQYYLPFFLGGNVVKLVVRDRETIQEAVRRFRKLVERSGIKKEMRRREYYEKPSETKRRARLRAERRAKRNRLIAAGGV